MIKFISKFFVVLSFIATGAANATLITTDLTEDTYITYKDIDWTWASPVNEASWESGSNILYGPELHAGWRYASLAELNTLRNELTLLDFTKKDINGDDFYVQSVEYWNSDFLSISESLEPDASDSVDDFLGGWISSDPSYYPGVHADDELNLWDRFYVRDIADRVSTPVPEPSTIMTFAIALIALSMRKRAIK